MTGIFHEPEHPRAVCIIGVVVVDVLEARGLPAGEDDHLAPKHLDEVPRLAALHHAHLRCLATQLVVHLVGDVQT